MRLTEAEYTAYLVRHGLTPEPSLRPVPTLAMDPASPEGVLANRLQAYATTAQWLFYHTYSSKRSTPGWPEIGRAHV